MRHQIDSLTKEHFENQTMLDSYKNYIKINKINNINFANSETSKYLFKDSDYLNNMNNVNVIARKFTSLEALKKKYIISSLSTITEREKLAFIWFIEKILELTKKNKALHTFIYNYIYISNTHNNTNNTNNTESKNNIIIAKNNSWLEYNMPHTHKNVIIFTSNWFANLVKKHSRQLVESALIDEGSTFIHELTHIHQRYYLNNYIKHLYSKWGFINKVFVHNINDFINKNRRNPDGLDLNWLWKHENNYIIFGAVYNSDKPSNLSDVSYILKKVIKTDNNIFNISAINNNREVLIENEEFNEFFGIINNHYHPNEIVAQYMEYYLQTCLNKTFNDNGNGNDLYMDNAAYIIFNDEIRHILRS